MNFENRIAVYISSIICGSSLIFIFFASEGFTQIRSIGDIILVLIILSIAFFFPFTITKGFFWVKKACNKDDQNKDIVNSSISNGSNNITIDSKYNKKRIIIILLCLILITFVILYNIFHKINSLEHEINFLEYKINSLEYKINSLEDEIDDIKDKINY